MLDPSGFPLALVGEAKGGSGLTWPDVYPLIAAAGRHALPLPLPETMLAGWLLDLAGLDLPEAPVTIADPLAGGILQAKRSDGAWRLSGELAHVPWGRDVPLCLAQVRTEEGAGIALFSLCDTKRQPDLNLAREPRERVTLADVAALGVGRLPAALPPEPLRFYGALLRSAQSAGAIERLVEQCVQYAGERVQFGRPIGKFQAIQQQIAVLGCEAAASAAAALYGFDQADTPLRQMAIASAKIRTGEAAGKAASIAHAVHGAIGFTYEHSLQFSTRRLWSWRSEFGSHAWWSRQLGRAMCGSDELWPKLTDGTAAVLVA